MNQAERCAILLNHGYNPINIGNILNISDGSVSDYLHRAVGYKYINHYEVYFSLPKEIREAVEIQRKYFSSMEYYQLEKLRNYLDLHFPNVWEEIAEDKSLLDIISISGIVKQFNKRKYVFEPSVGNIKLIMNHKWALVNSYNRYLYYYYQDEDTNFRSDLYGIILEIENILSDFLRELLTENYHDYWWVSIKENIREDCEQRKQSDDYHDELGNDFHPYYYCSLADYRRIIINEWHWMEKYFPTNFPYELFKGDLDALRKIRNRVMHPIIGVKIKESDFELTLDVKKIITQVIKEYDSGTSSKNDYDNWKEQLFFGLPNEQGYYRRLDEVDKQKVKRKD